MKNKKLIPIIIVALIAIAGFVGYEISQTTGELLIEKQPESAVVSYPEGATFEVKVNKQRLVKSYQWYLEDIAGNIFELQGISAKTNKLIVPSTEQMNNEFVFYCVITDKKGNEVVTDRVTLNKDNDDENKTVLYIGEFAIEPGQTLDLSTIDIGNNLKLGSGKISFDANGKDITLDNVKYDNTNMVCDYVVAPNVGLTLDVYQNEVEEYNVTFIGDNVIYNNYFDYYYNAGGIPFDFLVQGEGVYPLVNLIGDGNLTITNGTYSIRAIGDLMVDIDITLRNDNNNYQDGIVAHNMKISEGRKLDFEISGTALNAQGNLYIAGADIDVKSIAPHISAGMVAKNVINVLYNLLIDNSDIDIMVYTDPEICQSLGTLSAINCNSDIEIYDSNIKFDIDVIKDDDIYVSNINGITGMNILMENSNADINIDSEDIFNSFGMYSEGYIQLTNSDVKVKGHTNGMTYGIAAESDFNADESAVNVDVDSYDNYGHIGSYGIMCQNFVLKLTEANKNVRVKSNNGIAVGCNTHDHSAEYVGYTQGYEPLYQYMRENTKCSLPQNYEISTASVVESEDEYLIVETYYDTNDLTTPAKEVSFTAGAE